MSNSEKPQEDPMPVAEDWLTEAQLEQVRTRVRAAVCKRGVQLKTESDIFTIFPQLLSPPEDVDV